MTNSAPDPYDEARRHIEMALDDMRTKGVLPSANSLLVWYCHASGGYPDLSGRFSSIERSGETFSDAKINALSADLVGSVDQSEVIDQISRCIEGTLDETAARVGTAADREASYGRELSNFQQEVASDASMPTTHRLVVELLEKTKLMHEQTELLQRQLLEASESVTGLRQDLEIARQDANRDGLTAIANRKAFDLALAREVADAELHGQKLSLLLLDIDHFKQFNDRHGHGLGDQVLKLVAKTLTRCVKGQDTAARYGGEEFAIILPSTDLVPAAKVAEQVRRTVASNRIVLKNSGRNLGAVTLSIGVATHRPGEPPGRLLARSDQALYRAKQDGRNRVASEHDRGEAAADEFEIVHHEAIEA